MDFTLILFLFFGAAVFIQLLYFLMIYRKLAFHKESQGEFMSPVSVVVCGYNEAENWKRLIPLLLDQEYARFEIVVVNDQSTDNTKFVFKEWDWHPKLKVVTIDKYVKKGLGKKFALTLGIKAARYDHLLLTDADCYPKDKQWISSMVQYFCNQKEIVLGYGSYEKHSGILNKLIRFDTFQVALQYLSYALIGQSYMGVGRNLAYKKSLFFDNKGFASHIHIPSGDDDLFIRDVANSKNVAIAIHRSSQTFSEAKTTWSSWIRQKTRHLSTSGHYSLLHKFLLGFWAFSQLMFWALGIVLIALETNQEEVVLLMSLRLLIQGFIYFRVMKSLEERDLIWLFPLYEIAQLFFQLIFVFSNLFNRQTRW
tara:strand:- start:125 stop:1225 length:1101 start_codon:yes stop_codon:yes gene_type:complete